MTLSSVEPDIEDLIGLPDDEVRGHRGNSQVTYAALWQHPELRRTPEGGEEGSAVPGTQRVWVKTFGCSHNTSDSEVRRRTRHRDVQKCCKGCSNSPTPISVEVAPSRL